MSQDYLAGELGITQSAYSKIETGETDITFKRLDEIAKIMGVETQDIVNFNEQLVFHITQNETVNGVYGSVFKMTDEMKKLYDDRVSALERENEHLKGVIEKLLDK